jgi:hypothetical protein
MKKLEDLIQILQQNKIDLEKKFKVKNIAIFGSYARGEQSENSDIDILVEFKESVGFLFIHLADYLEKLLDCKIDLLTPDAIKPNRKKYITEDLVYV